MAANGPEPVMPNNAPEYISLVKPPGYAVREMVQPKVIPNWREQTSLLERTRTFTGLIAEAFPEYVLGQLLDAAVEAKVGDLLPSIGNLLGAKSGYLLRVNFVRDPVQGELRPGNPLVSAIGPGAEPVDALAESYRNPTIGAESGGGMPVRRYLWCYRSGEDLAVSCTNDVISDFLEGHAKEEARRRVVEGAFMVLESQDGFKKAQRAEYWNRVAAERLHTIKKLNERLVIESINRRFAASQQRFNRALTDYQAAERQIAATEREMALINGISSVMGLISAGLQARQQNQSKVPDGNAAAQQTRRQQLDVFVSLKVQAEFVIKNAGPELQKLDQELRTSWGRNGFANPEPIELP
jgi:hypothetical protein